MPTPSALPTVAAPPELPTATLVDVAAAVILLLTVASALRHRAGLLGHQARPA